jgi:hypothetical protein
MIIIIIIITCIYIYIIIYILLLCHLLSLIIWQDSNVELQDLTHVRVIGIGGFGNVRHLMICCLIVLPDSSLDNARSNNSDCCAAKGLWKTVILA